MREWRRQLLTAICPTRDHFASSSHDASDTNIDLLLPSHPPAMATQQFDTPAPRRTNRPAVRQPTGFTPPPPAKRPRGASRQFSLSRFATPARATGHGPSSLRDDRSMASSMDVDEGGIAIFERSLKQETVFAKSDELLVALHSHLPTEVKQVLKVAGTSIHVVWHYIRMLR